ncbi:MAG TPA: lysylphosphatidylglycerol synthase domain-containing protein [Gaiellaceae bacterium]|nr:lysylphosphatidylglycerol synthase domain-containing protein [Gaiellaceae bacterium]
MTGVGYVGIVGRARAVVDYVRTHRRLAVALQVLLVVGTVGFCVWAVRDEWSKAEPLLENARLGYVAAAFAAVAIYYLVFILGWIRMLAAWGIYAPYRPVLQAEMVSMLAKYLPGGLWMPAARTVALRRSAGVTETPTVLASILVEAALSAISGVVVFVISLAWVRGVDAPLLPLVLFAVLCALLLHPRIFRPIGNKLLRPFGAGAIDPLPYPLMVGLLIFYCGTWLIGGVGVYFLLRSLGDDPGLKTIPFLAGVSAVSAIVAVLAIFVPSGLGVREASMYGLLLAITTPGPALGATLLNRLAITVVEVVLFGIGVVTWRSGRRKATRRE